MADNLPDGRSPIAIAMHWASQVTTIAIEMVLPVLLGVWADKRLGTKGVFSLVGAIAGLWLGMWSLLRIAKILSADENGDGEKKKD
jgi:F0F1-type ATP synthase assembly protein I